MLDVQFQPGFSHRWRELAHRQTLPYQWTALNDEVPGAEPSYTVANWKVAAGEQAGEHHGFVFQDSDLYKWLEAVGLFLRDRSDPELEAKADSAIDLLARAQSPDGYLKQPSPIIAAPAKRRCRPWLGAWQTTCVSALAVIPGKSTDIPDILKSNWPWLNFTG